MMKALFTDLDGVIRIWDTKQIVDAEREAGLPPGSFWPVAFAPELLSRAVTGAMTDEEWRAEGGRRLRELYPDADVEMAIRTWTEMTGRVDEAVLELLRMCRRRVPVALISNATSRLPRDLERMGIHSEFDYIFNTSELGVAKPDPKVFRLIAEGVGVSPQEGFFVDDRPENVEAAARAGMTAHLHTDVAALESALRAAGLLRVEDGT